MADLGHVRVSRQVIGVSYVASQQLPSRVGGCLPCEVAGLSGHPLSDSRLDVLARYTVEVMPQYHS